MSKTTEFIRYEYKEVRISLKFCNLVKVYSSIGIYEEYIKTIIYYNITIVTETTEYIRFAVNCNLGSASNCP